MNFGDPELELIDPTPNIYALFELFDKLFFWGKLAGRAVVRWSKRMYSCAGICSYEGRGGLCDIALSEPLLKLRSRKNLVETLLHEMIHAYLFITCRDRDRDGHGPNFQAHMHRINKSAGVNISIYHDFHDEVKLYQTHIWRCNGPCQKWKPYFGIVRRSMNRAPGPSDYWWNCHQKKCGGTYIKIMEPEKQPKKKAVVTKATSTITKYIKNYDNNSNNKYVNNILQPIDQKAPVWSITNNCSKTSINYNNPDCDNCKNNILNEVTKATPAVKVQSDQTPIQVPAECNKPNHCKRRNTILIQNEDINNTQRVQLDPVDNTKSQAVQTPTQAPAKCNRLDCDRFLSNVIRNRDINSSQKTTPPPETSESQFKSQDIQITQVPGKYNKADCKDCRNIATKNRVRSSSTVKQSSINRSKIQVNPTSEFPANCNKPDCENCRNIITIQNKENEANNVNDVSENVEIPIKAPTKCNNSNCNNYRNNFPTLNGSTQSTQDTKPPPIFTGKGNIIDSKRSRTSSVNVVETVRNVWANKQLGQQTSSQHTKTTVQNSNTSQHKHKTSPHTDSPPMKVTKIDDYFKTTANKVLKDVYGEGITIAQSSNNKLIAISNSTDLVDCPVCSKKVNSEDINMHLDECLNKDVIEKLTKENEQVTTANSVQIATPSRTGNKKSNEMVGDLPENSTYKPKPNGFDDKEMDSINVDKQNIENIIKYYIINKLIGERHGNVPGSAPSTSTSVNAEDKVFNDSTYTEIFNRLVKNINKHGIDEFNDGQSSSFLEAIAKECNLKKGKCCLCNGNYSEPFIKHLKKCRPVSATSQMNATNEMIVLDDDDDDIFDETQTLNSTGTKSPCPCCLQMIEEIDMSSHLDQCLLI